MDEVVLMALDKRVIGLALMSLIVSALIVFTLAGERADQPVEILKNQYPSVLPAGETTFTFSLVARQRIANLEIRFLTATPVVPGQGDLVDPDLRYGPGDTPRQVLANVAKLVWFTNRSAALGIHPYEIAGTFEHGDAQSAFLLQDYSIPLQAVLGEDAALVPPLVFGAIMNETGHARYLEGRPDFFAFPGLNINVLTISHNDDEVRYVPDEKVWEGSDRLPMSQAPRGTLKLRSVERDDTVTVIATIDPKTFPPPSYRKDIALIQVILIYVDGDLFGEPIVNVVR